MSVMILIVDDDYMSRDVLQAHLENVGYQVMTANSGSKAVQLAEEHQPDLILMDVRMPVMNGYDACIQLKSQPHTAHIPVLLVTALEDEQAYEYSQQVGAAGLVTKPFNAVELLKQIDHLIGG
jgi:two-component system cell cycle response regulator